MKILELLCKCYNCDYGRTVVTIHDNNGGQMRGVPTNIPDYVKNMYVRDFKLGQMKNKHLVSLEIQTEGCERL